MLVISYTPHIQPKDLFLSFIRAVGAFYFRNIYIMLTEHSAQPRLSIRLPRTFLRYIVWKDSLLLPPDPAKLKPPPAHVIPPFISRYLKKKEVIRIPHVLGDKIHVMWFLWVKVWRHPTQLRPAALALFADEVTSQP